MDLEIPKFVHVYQEKLKEQAKVREEITALKPAVTRWLQSRANPKEDVSLGASKIKLQEVKTRTPVSKEHIATSLAALAIHSLNMPEDNAKLFAEGAAKYIYECRPEIKQMRVMCIQNRKRKREDIVDDMINGS